MELKIREREPQTLDEAVKFAQRFEVYKGAVETSSARHKVNHQVQEEVESRPEDKRGRRRVELASRSCSPSVNCECHRP
jgi:hypothetical protein